MPTPVSGRTRAAQVLVLLVIVATGTALSYWGYGALVTEERRVITAQIEADAKQRINTIGSRLRTSAVAVYSLSPFIQDSQPGTRADFRTVVENRLPTDRNIVGAYWIPRISADQRAAHVQAAREAGLADYEMVRRTPDGERHPRKKDRDTLFPISFAEPLESNAQWLGWDLATSEELAAAMDRAAQSGTLAVTAPLTCYDEPVIFVFRPLFSEIDVEAPDDVRREKLFGYLALAIRVLEMNDEAMLPFTSAIDTRVMDETAPDGRTVAWGYDAEKRKTSLRAPSSFETGSDNAVGAVLDAPGRTWSMECIPTQTYVRARTTNTSLAALILGTAVTLVAAAYAQSLMSRTAKVEQIVVQRTRELKEANASLEREILDRQRAEDALRESEHLLNTLLKHSPDFIYFKDKDSHFIRIGKTLSEYFGLADPSEAVGMSDVEMFGKELADQYLADEQQVMRTGEPVVNKEEEQISLSGKKTWILTSKVCLRNTDGEVTGTFGISRDITERRLAAEALRTAKESAEAANRAKSDFLANVSHEIRTPMNAIIGMTELVLDTTLSAWQRDYLAMVLESGESLLDILNDILDFSKIEAGKLDLQSSVFELRETIGDTMKALAFRAQATGLELMFHIRGNVPDRLIGDGGRLRQIVVNLVGNAIKFTEVGEVLLRVDTAPSDDQRLSLLVTVTDTGIGVPDEQQNAIFAAFEQADTSSTRKFGGTGLGLAICSRLVHLMGGRIWVESEVGSGSRFHVSIPFALADQGALDVPPPAAQHARILIVDDNETNSEILKETLTDWGMEVASATGAHAAWQLLVQANQQQTPYSVVVVDAKMPYVDGFALAERIRRDKEMTDHVIMMLTSGIRPDEITRCEELELTAHILKPVKPSELFEAIMMVSADPTLPAGEEDAACDADLPQLPPLRILLAEDSLVGQKLAVGILEKEGHSVFVTSDGRQAIAALENQVFDLILMDVQMPEMDGFEATATIRAKEKGQAKGTPIIAMTAHAMKGDRERCLDAGMDDYVPKPIRPKELFGKIRSVLGTQE
ncbi:MAG: response regulator [Pirellulaceae bacterium]